MLLKDFRNYFYNELNSLYDNGEVDSFFYIILDKLHTMKRVDVALNPTMELSEAHLQKWNELLDELKHQNPIQYILGETEFFGLPFLVNEHTLIPRPETEELVALILDNHIQTNLESLTLADKTTILDIGTGTGCIAISLAKNIKNAHVYALDVSKGALATAKENALLNQVSINFLVQNILETNDLQIKFDVIVSNPPYVRHSEKLEMKTNVLDYEPHTALFVEDNDPLIFYRKIAQLALKNLNPNGQLYFEINQYLGKEMVTLLENLGFKNVVLKTDIYGNDRMIYATLY